MKKLLSALLLLTIAISAAHAAPLPGGKLPGRTAYHVNDYAGILSQDARKDLEILLNKMGRDSKYPIEIVVSTFDTLGTTPFEEFMVSYAHRWRLPFWVEKDRRIHIVVIVKDGKVRIGVGYGILWMFPKSVVEYIVSEKLLPKFREGKYDEGIKDAIDFIYTIWDAKKNNPPPSPGKLAGIGIILIVLITTAAIFIRRRLKKRVK
jgi:uncharacterized protein